tara:strand:- start:82 stop:762 length:681 start_codon:yes stop_codon:yes gene_type:complete
MKKSFVVIILSIIFLIIGFNNKLVEKYVTYKLSKWVEKDVIFEEFNFDYPNLIEIKGLEIINPDTVYYDNIFEANIVTINLDLMSYLFDKLVIINELKIDSPSFYLELIVKKKIISESNEKITFEDNIGIAKKISESLPDKVWPQKKRDINFLISKSFIKNGKALIKISSIKDTSTINLSSFEFSNIGNQKGLQHYKDVLRIIFFDIFAREKDFKKRRILKAAYKF